MLDAVQRIADLANFMSDTMAATLEPDLALVLVAHLANDTLARFPPEQRAATHHRLTRLVNAALIATADA